MLARTVLVPNSETACQCFQRDSGLDKLTWLLRFPKKEDMVHALHLQRAEDICGSSHD